MMTLLPIRLMSLPPTSHVIRTKLFAIICCFAMASLCHTQMQEMVTDLRLATDLSLFSKVLSGRKCLFEEQTHNTAEDSKGKDERGYR